jgi:hypothetical protein
MSFMLQLLWNAEPRVIVESLSGGVDFVHILSKQKPQGKNDVHSVMERKYVASYLLSRCLTPQCNPGFCEYEVA